MLVSVVSIPCPLKVLFYIGEEEEVNFLLFNDGLYQFAFWKLKTTVNLWILNTSYL